MGASQDATKMCTEALRGRWLRTRRLRVFEWRHVLGGSPGLSVSRRGPYWPPHSQGADRGRALFRLQNPGFLGFSCYIYTKKHTKANPEKKQPSKHPSKNLPKNFPSCMKHHLRFLQKPSEYGPPHPQKNPQHLRE